MHRHTDKTLTEGRRASWLKKGRRTRKYVTKTSTGVSCRRKSWIFDRVGQTIRPDERASEQSRESERGGRREPTPRRGKFTGKISGKLQSRSSDSRLCPHPGVRGVSAESSAAFALSRRRCLWPAAIASSGGSRDSGRGGRTTPRVPPHQAAKRSIQGRRGHAPSQHQATPRYPHRHDGAAAATKGDARARLGVVVNQMVGAVGTRSTLGRPGVVEGWKRPTAEGRGSEQFGSATRRGHFAVRPFLH